jgi:hypothetical protein
MHAQYLSEVKKIKAQIAEREKQIGGPTQREK